MYSLPRVLWGSGYILLRDTLSEPRRQLTRLIRYPSKVRGSVVPFQIKSKSQPRVLHVRFSLCSLSSPLAKPKRHESPYVPLSNFSCTTAIPSTHAGHSSTPTTACHSSFPNSPSHLPSSSPLSCNGLCLAPEPHVRSCLVRNDIQRVKGNETVSLVVHVLLPANR